MRYRNVVLAVVLAMLLVLAGCSGGVGGGDGAGAEAPGDGGAGGGGAGGDGGDGGRAEAASGGEPLSFDGASSSGQVQQQAIIRTGHVVLEVEDYSTTRASLSAAARGRGGFVSDSTQEVHRRGNQTWTTGTVTFRVPADSFDGFIDRVKSAGEVRNSQTESRDVSDQLVDIEARLTNLRAQRARLRGLYEDAEDTEDVLEVDSKLADVQEEIERLEARKRALEERVALSTVTVELHEPTPGVEQQVERERWYDVGVVAAFLDSVSGVVVAVRALAVGGAYVAPYLLVFGGPLVGVVWFVARRRGGETAE